VKEERPNEISGDSEPGVIHVPGNGSGGPIPQGSQSLPCERSASATAVGSETGQSVLSRNAGGPRTIKGKQRSKRNALRHGIFSDIALLDGESRVKYNSLWSGLREAFQPIGELEEILVEDLAINRWHRRRLIQAEVAEIRKATEFMQWEHETRECNEVNEIGSQMSEHPWSEHELISKIDNPLVLQRCLDLLAELRRLFAKNGFTDNHTKILGCIYGNSYLTNLGDNLYSEYKLWRNAAEASEDNRRAEGYVSPEQCKSNVLQAIDREIRQLKRYSKLLAMIETDRMEIEALRLVVPESPALDRLLRYQASLDRSFDRTLSQLERSQRMRLGQPVLPKLEVRHSLSIEPHS